MAAFTAEAAAATGFVAPTLASGERASEQARMAKAVISLDYSHRVALSWALPNAGEALTGTATRMPSARQKLSGT